MQANLQELAGLVLDSISQAVLTTDLAGRIVMRNAAAQAMLVDGESIEQVLLLAAPGGPTWKDELQRLAQAAGPISHARLNIACRSGREVAADVRLSLLATPASPPIVLVVVSDVSAMVAMERRLVASHRLAAVGELAAKVAHELNNPLDGVLRYVGLAQRSDTQQCQKYLQSAHNGLMRMVQVIRSLLEQGRPHSDDSGPMDHILQEAVAAMEPRAKAIGVAIECQGSDTVNLPASGNLFQVFCNIIKNALDAMPDGGRLVIRRQCAGGVASIEFIDNGAGLPSDGADRIFEPFYTTKASGQGSGLGLAICREILRRLGGAIEAGPNACGGAKFTVRVPASVNPMPAAIESTII